MRRLTTLAAVLIAAAGLAACGGSSGSSGSTKGPFESSAVSNGKSTGTGSNPTQGNKNTTESDNSATITNSNSLSVTSGNRSYDGQNPGPECGANGQIKNKYISTVPGSTRRMQLPNGKFFGTLTLRHSTICQTAWGEVFFNDKTKPPGYDAVHVVISRPGGSFSKSIPFSTSDFVSPIFSAMLANDSQSGCVQAEAWVVVGGKTGKREITNCSSS